VHIEHQKKNPIIHPSAWVDSNAVISGEVIVEEEVYISPGAVIIAEGAPIHIKRGTIIMKNVVLKSSEGKTVSYPLLIEEHALIGPYAYLIGCTIEINGVVHIDTNLKAKTRVPTQHMAFGNPAKIYPSDNSGNIAKEIESLNFLDTLFQVKDKSKDLKYIAALEQYRYMLFEHKNDDIIKNFSSNSTDKL